jgi:hypothetical protein
MRIILIYGVKSECLPSDPTINTLAHSDILLSYAKTEPSISILADSNIGDKKKRALCNAPKWGRGITA